MLKISGITLAVAAGLVSVAMPAHALQTVVTQIDRNANGSLTYHFSVKTDPGETLTPGDAKTRGDFMTIYNFYSLIDGSAKSAVGWEFSLEEFGRIPVINGYRWYCPSTCRTRRT